jgi:hypothetical protein
MLALESFFLPFTLWEFFEALSLYAMQCERCDNCGKWLLDWESRTEYSVSYWDGGVDIVTVCDAECLPE